MVHAGSDMRMHLALFMSGLRKNHLLLHETEVEKYTQRYLKQSQVNDEEWTPGTVINAEVYPGNSSVKNMMILHF